MVGTLALPEGPEPLDRKRRGERVLDMTKHASPPGTVLNCYVKGTLFALLQNAVFSPNPLLSSCPARLCPLSFGEGVEFDPLPPKEIRYTSSVKYDSEKHFIDDVYMPVGLGISSCSQTVVCIPDCTWRSYKAEVHFEPRNKPLRFTSTTIVYPKHTKTVYTTTLDYNCRKSMRRFLSSIELESAEYPGNDYLLDGC
uniref:Uncharacterized protein n=1 Tax=Gopherus agassizii TaxID=38772 RepID=A0A452IC07_9SAUR